MHKQSTEPKVIICGQVFLASEKEPFVPSGVSYLGALEYDSKEGKVRCHECGEWKKAFGPHLTVHGLTSRAYKQKHGLRVATGLCSPGVSEGLRKRILLSLPHSRKFKGRIVGKVTHTTHSPMPERLNLRGHCKAQTAARVVRVCADLGHVPSIAERKELGLSRDEFHGEVLVSVGLTPNRGGKKPFNSKVVLIELLRDFYALNGRLPYYSEWKPGLGLPKMHLYKDKFGSISGAYEAAGLAAVARGRQREGLTGRFVKGEAECRP